MRIAVVRPGAVLALLTVLNILKMQHRGFPAIPARSGRGFPREESLPH